MKILGISGSLRAGSFNTKLLETAAAMVPADVTLEIFPLNDLPLFNEDVEAEGWPTAVANFRDTVQAADALLIATPEYNFSVSGVLKNALDWASRPPGKSPLVGKPAGILSAAAATTGGARAQAHLKQILAATLTPLYLVPEYRLESAYKAFADDGALQDEAAVRRLKNYMDGFVPWSRGQSS